MSQIQTKGGLFGSLANPFSVLRELGIRSDDSTHNSRAELDSAVKKLCESVILDIAQHSIEPLSNFLGKYSEGRHATTLTAKEISETWKQFQDCLETRFTKAVQRLRDYLDDMKTMQVITSPIKV